MEEKKKRTRPTVSQVRALESEVDSLRKRCDLLESDNSALRADVTRLSRECKELDDAYVSVALENERLMNRSFWNRIWNK